MPITLNIFTKIVLATNFVKQPSLSVLCIPAKNKKLSFNFCVVVCTLKFKLFAKVMCRLNKLFLSVVKVDLSINSLVSAFINF
jgi:hypothetical protein